MQQQQPGPWGDHTNWGASPGLDIGNIHVSRPDPPSSMRLATALMYVGAGLTVVSLFAFIASIDQLADSIAESAPWRSQLAIDNEVDRLQARELMRTIVGVSLWVWMAIKNGQGRKWARAVGTIFGIINLAGFALGASLMVSASEGDAGFAVPVLVVGAASAALAVVILVLLFRQESSDYYHDTTRWQAARTLRGY